MIRYDDDIDQFLAICDCCERRYTPEDIASLNDVEAELRDAGWIEDDGWYCSDRCHCNAMGVTREEYRMRNAS